MANATPQPGAPAPPQDDKAKREAAAKAKAEALKKADDAAFKQATQGVPDDIKEKVLAWGGDVSRGSPDLTQNLGDPPLGITTTSGAYKTPIDPTTAAAPLKADEVNPQAPKGYPTVGSGRKSGTPEKQPTKEHPSAA